MNNASDTIHKASVTMHFGSYFQAAALSHSFNIAARNVSETRGVGHILEKAVEFLSEITPQLQDGWVLSAREPRPYMPYAMEDILTIGKAGKIASQYLPGDGQGHIQVETDLQTAERLEGIQKDFKLGNTQQAARLAIDLYNRMNVQGGGAQYYLYNTANRAERKEVVSYKLPKGAI